MLYCLSLAKAPHKPFLEVGEGKTLLCLGKDLYTLSDLRVPLQEYKVNYAFSKRKKIQNSKLLR
jgi:hypothetical protein